MWTATSAAVERQTLGVACAHRNAPSPTANKRTADPHPHPSNSEGRRRAAAGSDRGGAAAAPERASDIPHRAAADAPDPETGCFDSGRANGGGRGAAGGRAAASGGARAAATGARTLHASKDEATDVPNPAHGAAAGARGRVRRGRGGTPATC